MSNALASQDEAPHIDVRILPPPERHAQIFSTLGGLIPGGILRITSDHEPRPLHYQLETNFPGKFNWEYIEQGPEVWRVEITRLGPGCDCSCGSN